MLFGSGFDLLRVLIVGSCAYIGLIVLLRLTGKRTLSKMNAFDLVVTVALGSTLATVLLSKDVALAEGLLAFALLCLLQLAVTFLSVRWPAFQRLVKAEPALLLLRGRFLRDVMRRERVTEEEVLAALRGVGLASPDSATAVVLETDGSLSVIAEPAAGSVATLRTVTAGAGTGAAGRGH